MREIVYKYNNLGLYTTQDSNSFDKEKSLKIVVEPHDFSIEVGNQTLRNSSFAGCVAVVSCDGEVVFYDTNQEQIAKAHKGEECYSQVMFKWEQGFATIEFGSTVEVDYYPNCDGEHDRYGTEWNAKRTVKLNLENCTLEIK